MFKDSSFECRVTDQGRGIPESFRKQIFEPFKQVQANDSASKKGTGLGLAISRSIVEKHGGQIAVDSEEGKGSTFWFKLPQKRSTDQNENTTVLSNSAAMTNMRKPGQLQLGKFRILFQGLVIIAVPLIFQNGFALAFNEMLNGICKQTEQEENSMKVLVALNRATDCIAGALQPAIGVVYLPLPAYSKTWETADRRARHFLDEAIKYSSSSAEQLKDLNKTKQVLDLVTEMFDYEAKTHQSKIAFDKLDFAYRKMVYKMYGLTLKPSTPEESVIDLEQFPDPKETMASFRALSHDNLHAHLFQFLQLKSFLDEAIDREKTIGQQAFRQRNEMLENLKWVFGPACGWI